MTWRIVEDEEACGKPFGATFEDVNCLVNLPDQVLCREISITVLPCLEDKPGLTLGR